MQLRCLFVVWTSFEFILGRYQNEAHSFSYTICMQLIISLQFLKFLKSTSVDVASRSQYQTEDSAIGALHVSNIWFCLPLQCCNPLFEWWFILLMNFCFIPNHDDPWFSRRLQKPSCHSIHEGKVMISVLPVKLLSRCFSLSGLIVFCTYPLRCSKYQAFISICWHLSCGWRLFLFKKQQGQFLWYLLIVPSSSFRFLFL